MNAARANILPSFSMTAEYGQGSYKLADILSPQSLLYSIAGNMVANVFDYDKKDNLLGQARARNKELLESYANTVLFRFSCRYSSTKYGRVFVELYII